jgi:hypothetical protein
MKMVDLKKLLVGLGVALLGVEGEKATAQPLPHLVLKARPEHVHPLGPGGERRWVTRLLVKLDAPTPTDVAIRLAAQLPAVLSTPYVLIPKGDSSAEVEVTAVESGKAETYAWVEESGDDTKLDVHFHLPPSKLRVLVDPARSFGIGRAGTVVVRVELLGEDGRTSKADEDIPVGLRVPLGTLDRGSTLVVKKGEGWALAQLVAFGSGVGEVTANADGLGEANGRVEFVFPWTALVLAMLGGAFGAACRTGFRRWPSSLLAALPGFVFGLVVYGVAAFVPADQLPGAVQSMATLPVTSGLGAAVLGVAGGYCGYRLIGGSEPHRRSAKPA